MTYVPAERPATKPALIHETVGGEPYKYLPLGKYVVSAPGVCGGRPTFKYTRVEVAGVLERIGAGHPIDELVAGYRGRITRAAIQEAVKLAAQALVRHRPKRAATCRGDDWAVSRTLAGSLLPPPSGGG